MTLQQIKDSLPKYRYLTPGVDVWRAPAEIGIGDTTGAIKWYKPVYKGQYAFVYMTPLGDKAHIVLEVKLREGEIGRIKIPDEVLENQAFWVLYNKLATVKSGNYRQIFVANGGEDTVLGIRFIDDANGVHGFTADDRESLITLLGGEENIIKHLSAGNLYEKWLGEQLT